MLTLKQTPIALIGIFLACGLADGEPTQRQLLSGFAIAVFTVSYVIVMNYLNTVNHGRKRQKLRGAK